MTEVVGAIVPRVTGSIENTVRVAVSTLVTVIAMVHMGWVFKMSSDVAVENPFRWTGPLQPGCKHTYASVSGRQ